MWEAPSVATLSKTLRNTVRSLLPSTDPWIWPNNLYVVLKVVAQALRAAYLRVEWVHRQARVVTADTEAMEMHGLDIGITRLPATFASGNLLLTTTPGTNIPEGTRFLRGDNVAFISTLEVDATTATTIVPVVAVEDGKLGNTESLAPFTLETPITGVGAITVDAIGLTGGAEQENDTSLRARILDRKRNPPHGGSPGEYISWAREVPGVTRVFVKRATPNPGQVTVLFMMDDTYVDGIPSAGDIDTVLDHLIDQGPSDADIIVKAPESKEVDVEIDNLKPNNAAMQERVRLELLAMFRRRAQPGFNGATFKFYKSWLDEAISMASGEVNHDMTLPATNIITGAPTGGAVSTGTLTVTANPTAGETVIITPHVYTFRATVPNPFDVKIGATASDSLDNLIAAINAGTGSGTLYGTGTSAHTLVGAAAGAGDTMDVTANTMGTAGNSITTKETLANGSWGSTTMTGGTNQVLHDGQIAVLGDLTFL